MYVDDDWVPWADGSNGNWPHWYYQTYGDYIAIIDEKTTNKDDWLDRITQDYEWGHLCAHSNAHAHYLYESGTSPPLTNGEINLSLNHFFQIQFR